MAKLSLCMIVKNKERFLPQCLESVKDIADEIIIVDFIDKQEAAGEFYYLK